MTSENENPFPGLRPFRPDEGDRFFGRDDEIYEMLQRLRQIRFLAVLGSSGCGKSSLVKAGLLPPLADGFLADRPDGWLIAMTRPGDNPYAQLAEALIDPKVFGSGDIDPARMSSMTQAALRSGPLGLVKVAQRAGLKAGQKLLVLADQFEELFSFIKESDFPDARDEAAAFVELLVEATRQYDVPIYVVLTMRSEFLGHCTPFAGLPEAINDGLYLVPRMTRDQFRDAILKPIELRKAEVENAGITTSLVNRLLNDLRLLNLRGDDEDQDGRQDRSAYVSDDQDQLPVLEHALMRLWNRWTKDGRQGPIDENTYNGPTGIDRLDGALLQHVEEIRSEVTHDLGATREELITQRLFRQLTQVTPEGNMVRQRVRFSAICKSVGAQSNEDCEDVRKVVDAFCGEGRSLLVLSSTEETKDDPLIDISHESLIRQWAELKRWTRDEAKSRRVKAELAREADKWQRGIQSGKQDEDFVLSPAAMGEADELTDRHLAETSDVAREFLAMNINLREEQAKLREKQARQKAFHKFQNVAMVVIVSVVALVAWLGLQNIRKGGQLTSILKQQRSDAEQRELAAKNEAERQSSLNRSGRLSRMASGLLNENPVASMLLAYDALGAMPASEPDDTKETKRSLREAAKEAEQVLRNAVARNRTPRILDSSSGVTHVHVTENNLVDPNQRWLITAGGDDRIRLRGLRNGQPMDRPVVLQHKLTISDLAISRDGKWLASGDAETIRVWNLTTIDPTAARQVQPEFELPATNVADLEFSPDGRWLVADTWEEVQVWDLHAVEPTLSPLAPLQGHSGGVKDIAFSGDGGWLAVAGDKGVRLWQFSPDGPTANAIQLQVSEDYSYVHQVMFFHKASSEGNTELLVTLGAGKVQLWYLSQIQQQQQQQQQPQIEGILRARTPTPADNANRAFKPSLELAAEGIEFSTFALSADRRWIVAAGIYGNLYLWDLNEIELDPPKIPPPAERVNDEAVQAFFFKGDNSQLVTVGVERKVQIWNMESFTTPTTVEATSLPALNGTISPVAIKTLRTSDHILAAALHGDQFLALGTASGDVYWWDLDSENPTGGIQQDETNVDLMVVSPDMKRRWMVTYDSTAAIAELWDLSSIPAVSSFEFPKGTKLSWEPFSYDGRWLATVDRVGGATLWELNEDGKPTAHPVMPTGSESSIFSVEFGYEAFAAIHQDSTISVWKTLRDGSQPKPFNINPGDAVSWWRISPSDRWLAAEGDGNLQVWDIEVDPPKLIRKESLSDDCLGLSFSPDREGRWLASGLSDGKLKLFPLPSGRPIPFEGDAGIIVAHRFSHNGKSLVTVTDDSQALVWNLDPVDLQNPKLLSGFGTSVALSADNRYVASFASEFQFNELRVWDISGPSGFSKPDIAVRGGHLGPQVAFKDDWIISAGPEGIVFEPMTTEGLKQQAEKCAPRNFTWAEWRQHFGESPYKRTFLDRPVHPSIFDPARDLARKATPQEGIEPAVSKYEELRTQHDVSEPVPVEELKQIAAISAYDRARLLVRQASSRSLGKGGETTHQKDLQKAEELFGFAQEFGQMVDSPKQAVLLYHARALIKEGDALAENKEVEKSAVIRTWEMATNLASELQDEQLKASLEFNLDERLNSIREEDDVHSSFYGEVSRIVRQPAPVTVKEKIEQAIKKLEEAKEADQEVDISQSLYVQAENLMKYSDGIENTKTAVALFLTVHGRADREKFDWKGTASNLYTTGRNVAANDGYGELKVAEEFLRGAEQVSPNLDFDGELRLLRVITPSFKFNPVLEAEQFRADWLFENAANRLIQTGSEEDVQTDIEKAKALDDSLDLDALVYLKRFRAERFAQAAVNEALVRDVAVKMRLENTEKKLVEAKLAFDFDFDPATVAKLHVGRAMLEEAKQDVNSDFELAVKKLDAAKIVLGEVQSLNPYRILEFDSRQHATRTLNFSGFGSGFDLDSPGNRYKAISNPDKYTARGALYIFRGALSDDPLLNPTGAQWNAVSWQGMLLDDRPQDYLFAANLSVMLEPWSADHADTRALARARCGDRKGAIRDWNWYVARVANHHQRLQRQVWIKMLEDEELPVEHIFRAEVLNAIQRRDVATSFSSW